MSRKTREAGKWMQIEVKEINCMNTYVIRVYRYAPANPRAIVGVVETIGIEGNRAFTNYDDLWKIIFDGNKEMQNKRGNKKRKMKGWGIEGRKEED
jgi:hypothetical protein